MKLCVRNLSLIYRIVKPSVLYQHNLTQLISMRYILMSNFDKSAMMVFWTRCLNVFMKGFHALLVSCKDIFDKRTIIRKFNRRRKNNEEEKT